MQRLTFVGLMVLVFSVVACQGEVDSAGGDVDSVTLDSLVNGVDETDAVKVAANWMTSLKNDRLTWAVRNVLSNVVIDGEDEFVTSFTVNFENGGFAIVAADYSVKPILGYSTEGTVEAQTPNPAFKSYMETLNNRIYRSVMDSVSGGRTLLNPRTIEDTELVELKWSQLLETASPIGGGQVIGPLVTAKWNQEGLYNANAPEINGTKTSIGCVAVAVGQIMHYHGFPAAGAGTNAYGWDKNDTWQDPSDDVPVTSDFARHRYDWSSMPDQLDSSSSTEEKATVAEFLYDVSIGVHMNFGLSGTSTSTLSRAQSALSNYFRYAGEFMVLRNRLDYLDDGQAWIEGLRYSLSFNLPLVYSANNHAFVIDGVDADDLFHVNWGYGGANDGFFSVEVGGPDNAPEEGSVLGGITPYQHQLGGECAGFGGEVCETSLVCKHLVSGVGECRDAQWCHSDTAIGDCEGQSHDSVDGYWGCENNGCVWLQGGSNQQKTESNEDVSIGSRVWIHYGPFAHVGGAFSAEMDPLSGDPDLYVLEGGQPTSGNYDCRPYDGGTADEACSDTAAGTYFVSVYGYRSSVYNLTINWNEGGGAPPAPVCSNGVVDGVEVCDGNTISCIDLDATFIGGTAGCLSDCSGFDVTNCELASCGDEQVEGHEICDGDEIVSCTQINSTLYSGGTAYCNPNYSCVAWVLSQCDWRNPTCGNRKIEGSEACDGPTLCSSLNPSLYENDGQKATCDRFCETQDTSRCTVKSSECGNGVLDSGEECDDSSDCCDLTNCTFKKQGTSCDGGECTADGSCEPVCGNGVIEPGEECDDSGECCASCQFVSEGVDCTGGTCDGSGYCEDDSGSGGGW